MATEKYPEIEKVEKIPAVLVGPNDEEIYTIVNCFHLKFHNGVVVRQFPEKIERNSKEYKFIKHSSFENLLTFSGA